MRLNLDGIKQPLTASDAAAAAGITETRLNLWIHRGQFLAEEDRRQDRIKGDPRQYTATDVLRMRALAVCTNRGLSIDDARKAVDALDKSNDPEAFILLMDRGEGFDTRVVRRDDLPRVLSPAGAALPPPAVFAISIENLIAETRYRLDLISAERESGRDAGGDFLRAAASVESERAVTA